MRNLKQTVCVCLIAFVVSGCYTQIRSPLEGDRASQSSKWNPQGDVPDVVVQRFEYYHNYNRHPMYHPYHFDRYHYYDSPIDWLYTRRPHWYQNQIAWNYACWISVYHPTWRRYPPAVLIPYVVHRSPILVSNDEPRPVVNKRPQRRRSGIDGRPTSAEAIRTNSVNTRPRTETQPQPRTETSRKQTTTEKKKEEEKEEKRTEKRSERKRRGGMR